MHLYCPWRQCLGGDCVRGPAVAVLLTAQHTACTTTNAQQYRQAAVLLLHSLAVVLAHEELGMLLLSSSYSNTYAKEHRRSPLSMLCNDLAPVPRLYCRWPAIDGLLAWLCWHIKSYLPCCWCTAG
jgi:hypothetical protein